MIPLISYSLKHITPKRRLNFKCIIPVTQYPTNRPTRVVCNFKMTHYAQFRPIVSGEKKSHKALFNYSLLNVLHTCYVWNTEILRQATSAIFSDELCDHVIALLRLIGREGGEGS